MPRVSIVTPAYNPGPFLQPAIESVLAQTFTDWDWAIVDDGSAEDLSWVDSIDPRIRLIRQDNAGMAGARNAGLEATDGEYVAFLDADDVWVPTKLTRQLEVFDQSSDRVGLVATLFDIVDADLSYVRDGWPVYTDPDDVYRCCPALISTTMARRVAIPEGGFRQWKHVADWDFFIRASRSRWLLAGIDAPLVKYRRHGSNESNKYRELHRETTALLGEFADAPTADEGIKTYKRLFGTQAYDDARAMLRERRLRAFLSAWWYALRNAPRYTAGETAKWLRPRRDRNSDVA